MWATHSTQITGRSSNRPVGGGTHVRVAAAEISRNSYMYNDDVVATMPQSCRIPTGRSTDSSVHVVPPVRI